VDPLAVFGSHGVVEGKRVLDVGCGLGASALAVSRAGASEVVGVDTDLGKISRAAEAARRMGAGRVQFLVQSGAGLGVAPGRFDVVLLLDVIEHVADPVSVLAECAGILRLGGRVLLSFPPYDSPWGAHLFTQVPVPWVHLLADDRAILDLWRESHSEGVERGEIACSPGRARAIMEAENTAELWDCNRMTIQRFLRSVDQASLTPERVRYKVFGNLGGWVTRRPKLREFLVTRVSAVLVA
jgi:SAM-dependent methyltransferase